MSVAINVSGRKRPHIPIGRLSSPNRMPTVITMFTTVNLDAIIDD